MAADPVAENSTFLKTYMSHHPDTLVAYAKFYGKVDEPIVSAELSAIDCNSMTLGCTMKIGARRVVHVPIIPPLKGYDDVKPRLLEMKSKAQEGLGMIKTPQIKDFRFPFNAIQTLPLVALLFYSTLAVPPFRSRDSYLLSPRSPWLVPGKWLVNTIARAVGLGNKKLMQWIWSISLGLHFSESFYTFALCHKHSMPFIPTMKYVGTTWLAGYPAWVDLRRRIAQARINSATKVE